MQTLDLSDRDRLLKETSVLFVDDDPLARTVVQRLLANSLKALHLASGGQEGLYAYAFHQPDIVITDVSMPGMDGLTMVKAIREIKPDVPVLLLTAFDTPSMLRQAIALGITDYLIKPLEDYIVLLDVLARTASTLHLKRELERQLRLNQLMLDASPFPSMLVDLEPGRIVASNKLAASLGYNSGQNCDGALIPQDMLTGLRKGGETLISAASSREIEAHGRHWVLHWALVGVGVYLFTAVDITQRKQLEEDLKCLAATDPLTGIGNRRHFLGRAEEELARSSRYNLPLAFLMLDIDDFKTVNDTFGHDAGDEVLKSLTSTLQKTLRTTDVLGRLGGEEFGALLIQMDIGGAKHIAERLRQTIKDVAVETESGLVHFTVSIGLAASNGNKDSVAKIMKRIDLALYNAKETGRNRVCCFGES